VVLQSPADSAEPALDAGASIGSGEALFSWSPAPVA
jgi:hypothetical protein